MLCVYCKVVLDCQDEEVAKEGHYVGAVEGTRCHLVYNSLVVTQQVDADGVPAVAPYCCCKDNGLEHLPLDISFQLGCVPVAIELLPH